MSAADRGIATLMSQPGSGCRIETGRVTGGLADPRSVCAPSLSDSEDG